MLAPEFQSGFSAGKSQDGDGRNLPSAAFLVKPDPGHLSPCTVGKYDFKLHSANSLAGRRNRRCNFATSMPANCANLYTGFL